MFLLYLYRDVDTTVKPHCTLLSVVFAVFISNRKGGTGNALGSERREGGC